ncbi:hypothetical protein [Paenibacillus qinlingensis]|uniref:Glycoside hydrolase family 5 domain-containing protein n=1 Tax=Paenibacillus qinlingensis TaxID=1837343 RepID=A0ABU1NTV1_9BACL|nr:hypothetical protein [Paenibacillus qinlingensis]MDR6550865.1 hypothetical protein [Paenibacillus qinlingensis]
MSKRRHTHVQINGGQFLINGQLTYKCREWHNCSIEGLLLNSRMVQGIFDDSNPQTQHRWAYPDTGVWCPDRNTREFAQHMKEWRSHGLLAFTLGLQGGSPEGYSRSQPWRNSAFLPDGSLDIAYMNRLEVILDQADELGMVVILNYFYFGQDNRFESERAVQQATANATAWLHDKGYTNVLIEIANECDNVKYYQPILKPDRITELIELVQIMSRAISPEQQLAVGTSFIGGSIPTDRVVELSDFILIHGNGMDMNWLPLQIEAVRRKTAYRGQPIVNNEDDHFDFDLEDNHLIRSIQLGVSWGYFDPGANDYLNGYQSVPVNWGLSTERKMAFFRKVQEITGASGQE